MFHDMYPRRTVACIARRPLVALILLTAPSLAAQEEPSDLKPAAKQVAKDIAKANLSAVAVADFVAQNGDAVIAGHYLAQEFARSLEQSNKRLAVTEPGSVAVVLSSMQLSANDLATPDQLSKISETLHADAIVTGIVEISQDRYVVHIAVRNAKDRSLLVSRDQKVKRPAYADMLVLLDPTGKAERVAKPGADGVTIPQCANCPAPTLPKGISHGTSTARVNLSVVINTEGRVVRAVVIESSDTALAAKAVEAIKTWRFTPALDKNGKPVAVIAPVFVTFNVY